MAESLKERLAQLPAEARTALLAKLPSDQQAALLVSWAFTARPEQLAPTWAWRWWLLLTGRGFGKTRTGAEWVIDRCEAFALAGMPHLIGIMNATNEDARAIQIAGESGLRAVAERRGHDVDHSGSALHGSIRIRTEDGWHVSDFEIYTGMEPDKPRGRNLHTLWCDELASWKHKVDALGGTAFTNADFALRARCPAGMQPQGVVTTTPKPVAQVKHLLGGEHGATAITRGSMLANRSHLDPAFIQGIMRRYKGTRLEAQEVAGEVLDEVEGALWSQQAIDQWRVKWRGDVPELATVVIGLDPSGSDGGDECGIVVVGLARQRDRLGRPHVYVLDDRSVQNRPSVWGPLVVELRHEFQADAVVAETNFGAALVVDTLRVRDPSIPVHEVRASKGKRIRAEPVSVLYEAGTGQCHHVGYLAELEEQMCTWTPLDPDSPDRLDALVWAVTWLIPELAMPSVPAQGSTWAELEVGPDGGVLAR